MMPPVPGALVGLVDFYRAQRQRPPRVFGHQVAAVAEPEALFSVSRLQDLLNNPLLTHDWVTLFKKGQRLALDDQMLWKTVQVKRLLFMDKSRLNAEIADGAAVLLEGLDVLDPSINALLAHLDAGMPCGLANAVAFCSQRGHEAYQGHRDSDDVLVLQISGEKTWEIYEPQQRRYFGNQGLSQADMGPLAAKLTLKAGDALYVRAGVPHRCHTPMAHSLHLSFDLCDRTPNIEQITHQANQLYNRASADPYQAPGKITEHYLKLLQSPSFQAGLQQATEATRRDAQVFRQRIGQSAVVTALARLRV